MKVSDYIVSYLSAQNIRYIYGYIGGMITHLVDSIARNPGVQYIQTYHEQTAGIAAEGYAIESQNFGVAICTSGPGFTNMVTAIADAYLDSIPVLFISGQVNTTEYKYNKPIRQQGFQELNVINISKSITKYSVLIDNAENIRYELEKAVYIATHGRKGPVLIDLPMDISRADINPDELNPYVCQVNEEPMIDIHVIENIVQDINSASRPVFLLGGGVKGATKQMTEFLNQAQIPVVTSLKGKGCIDERTDYFVGMIGAYGNRCANMILDKADLLVAVGTRLDTRQTGARYQDFLKGAKILRIDIDEDELKSHRIEHKQNIKIDASEFFILLNKLRSELQDHANWCNIAKGIKKNYNQDVEIQRFVKNKSPYEMIKYLDGNAGEDDVFVVDVGQNEMWAAQTLQIYGNRKFICSGGLAPMGFALPAAIGIAMANPKCRVYAIVGDGGLQMSEQSLLTIAQYKLNIVIIVMNNESLGMITQFQHLYFNDKMEGTTQSGGYIIPDIRYLAQASFLRYKLLDSTCLSSSDLFECETPIMIDYRISGRTEVSPKLEYNSVLSQPTPKLSDEEYFKFEMSIGDI